jgi:hypothetical protein
MEIGGEYTITFNADFISGTGPQLAFRVMDSGSNTIQSISINADGAYFVNFIATDTTCVFRWDLMTVGFQNFWRVYNMNLFKTAVA